MDTPLEAHGLYLLITAVPLLQLLNGDVASSVLMTTAWLLAGSFAGWQLIARFTHRGRPAV